MSKYLFEVGVEELPYKFIPMAIDQLKQGFEKFLVDEEGYIYKCGYNESINIRVINGWYDISGTPISGSC